MLNSHHPSNNAQFTAMWFKQTCTCTVCPQEYVPADNFDTKPNLFFLHYSLCFEAPIFPKIMLA